MAETTPRTSRTESSPHQNPATQQDQEIREDNWPEKIREVIEQRMPFAAWLHSTKDYLRELQRELMSLENLKNELSAEEVFKPHVENITFESLARRAGEQSAQLDALGRRFERDTLNVAVVGMVNQGKSFLLRTLSGLEPDVIPDRGRQHGELEPLTGARSTIIHDPDAPVRGRVTFHSEGRLLDMLNDYRAELLGAAGEGGEAVAAPYQSLEDFMQRPLPAGTHAAAPGRFGALVKQLKKYRHLLRHNRRYVGHAPLDNLSDKQIKAFITQSAANTGEQPSEYLYLAVEKVEIRCRFPHEQVGRIALIDLPGLGEATLGGPERLMETLKLDADIALFVWRPMPGDQFEGNEFIDLYDTCYQAMKHLLPLHEWSFLVLNHDRMNNNLRVCEEALQKTKEKEAIFNFFSESICDCSSPTEVYNVVLRPVLSHLAKHMSTLDRRVASSCARDVEVLSKDASDMLQKARAVFGGANAAFDNREFERRFTEKWDSLRLGLNSLVSELKSKTDAPDEAFVRQVGRVLEDCKERRFLLSPEEATKKIQIDTAFDRVYTDYLVWTRAHIADSLRALDTALDQPLLDIKARVGEVFGAEGGFGDLAKDGGLEALSARIAPYSPTLSGAFDNLLKFQMSARGIIGYKIRDKLRALEPYRSPSEQPEDREPDGVAAAPTPANAQETPAPSEAERQGNFRVKLRTAGDGEKVATTTPLPADEQGGVEAYKRLTALLSDTLDEIKETLSEDFSRPNQVAYAVVADFVDSIVHARYSESEWRNVYNNLRNTVWPLDYELHKSRQRKRERWLAASAAALQLVSDKSPSLPGYAGVQSLDDGAHADM